jgi:hypothetical protein
MINKMSHVSIYVLDQDSAFDFYVNKLGFKVATDAAMGPGMRWLTVSPPDQPDLEITLMAIKAGMMFTEESAGQMKSLVKHLALVYSNATIYMLPTKSSKRKVWNSASPLRKNFTV